jgi:hypothetical protein
MASVNLPSKRTLLVVIAGFVLASTAAAQQKTLAPQQSERPLLGPQLGVATNSYDVFIGAQFAYPVAKQFDIYPSFDYYFPSSGFGTNVTVWALNADVRYWPKLNMANSGLYVGAGLNYTHVSVSVSGIGSGSGSETGLGLLGGWDFKAVGWRPFGQIRFVLGNADRIEFGGGINFKL